METSLIGSLLRQDSTGSMTGPISISSRSAPDATFSDCLWTSGSAKTPATWAMWTRLWAVWTILWAVWTILWAVWMSLWAVWTILSAMWTILWALWTSLLEAANSMKKQRQPSAMPQV